MTKMTKEPKDTKKGKKDTKDSKITTKTVVRMLPCKLSEKERAKLAEDLESNMSKIEAIELQKKTADDGFKKDIGLLEEVQGNLRTMIRTGAEEREVKCEEITDYVHGEIRVIRLDTKETFSKRTMTKEESQLPLIPKDKPAGKLLAMDGGKGKLPQIVCRDCKGACMIPFGPDKLLAKCETCDGTGKVDDKEPLKAKLGDVAAQHAKNKAEADAAAAAPAKEGDGHPEVEKIIKARTGRKSKANPNGADLTPPPGCDF